MKTYSQRLLHNGILLLSGFYKEDIPVINEEVSKYGLTLEKTLERNNWVSLKYIKG
jgi:ribosomal protein L11 methyltransferase